MEHGGQLEQQDSQDFGQDADLATLDDPQGSNDDQPDPPFDDLQGPNDDQPDLTPTNLSPVQLSSYSSSSVFEVLPADARTLLGPKLGSLVDALCVSMGKHPMMGVLPLLSLASGVCGHDTHARVHSDLAWVQRAIIWSAVVAASGAGKNPVIASFISALELMEAAINVVLRKQGRPEVVLLAISKTFEHLKDHLKGKTDRVAIYVSDELTGQLALIGAFKKGQSGADVDMSLVLDLRGGGRLVDSTITRGASIVPKTHVIYTGGMQPIKMLQYLSNKNARQRL